MKNQIFYSFIFFLIISCSQPVKVEFNLKNLSDSINSKEADLKRTEILLPGNSLAIEIIQLYKQFADSFPNEKDAPQYLFKAANVSIGVRQFQPAISFLERIKKYYAEYEKSPESLFLMAFIYDNYLDQKGKAREIYQEVIDTYPSHKFASDAKEVIKTLEMTDEELIKMFEEKEKENSLAKGKGK